MLQENTEGSEEFDTVLMAIGRKALTAELQLNSAGVEVNKSNHKIHAVNEETNVPHIYAVGDVLQVSEQKLKYITK